MIPPGGADAPVTAAATFCATLVDEWIRGGVTDAVICPGSRSSPMALALADAADAGRLALHVHHDERAAGFVALGLAMASGWPAPVLVTSGTAAVELHPAVVEAHHAQVPFLALTADRPPDLHDVGAPQTIDQVRLYGPAVRWFADPGVPDAAAAGSWRPLAARCLTETIGSPPGPVQLNLAFREPLVGRPGPLPPARTSGRPWRQTVVGQVAPARVAEPAGGADFDSPVARGEVGTVGVDDPLVGALADALADRRVTVVAGAGIEDPDAVTELAGALGWPVLADPRSGTRVPGATTIAHADALLRHPGWAATMRPDVVLCLGARPASKVVNTWLAVLGEGVWSLGIDGYGRLCDPDGILASVVTVPPGALCAALADRMVPSGDRSWVDRWLQADAEAAAAITEVLAGHHEPTEPAIARDLMASLPDGAALVVSSSMPVRDLEWYSSPRRGVRVMANRGANGIDGVVSTAVGVALESRRRGAPTAVLVGDVAFLHDTNALVGLVRRPLDLVVVVVDNGGGGIFEFLDPATSLERQRFEQLFATPHDADLAALASAHGLAVRRVVRRDDLGPAVADAVLAGGARVIVVATDRRANVALHDKLNGAVAVALDRAGLGG